MQEDLLCLSAKSSFRLAAASLHLVDCGWLVLPRSISWPTPPTNTLSIPSTRRHLSGRSLYPTTMATDPFHTFASTVRSSLAATRELSSTYTSLAFSSSSAAAGSSELITAQDRLNDALEALQQDVEDVRQSIAVVKRSPERFGVDVGELRKREEFLRVCEAEVEVSTAGRPMKGGAVFRAQASELTGFVLSVFSDCLLQKLQRSASIQAGGRRGGHASIGIAEDHDDEDHNAAFEKEQQQVSIIEAQGAPPSDYIAQS